MKTGRTMKMVVAAAALVVTAGACQPGWVNAMIGSGDGTGAAPGTVGAPYQSASLQQPTGVASGPDGSVYVYDSGKCAVYRMSGDTLSLYAGTPGSCGNSGNGGPATSAQIDAGISVVPGGGSPNMYPMTVDGSGNLYFFGSSDWTLRRVDAATGQISATAIPHDTSEYDLPGVTGLAADRDGSIVVLLWTFATGAALRQADVCGHPSVRCGELHPRHVMGHDDACRSRSHPAGHWPRRARQRFVPHDDGDEQAPNYLFRIDASTGGAVRRCEQIPVSWCHGPRRLMPSATPTW